MTAYQWISTLLALFGLVSTVGALIATVAWRRQKVQDEALDKIDQKVTRVGDRLSETREDMMQNYVRHDALRSLMSELESKISAKIDASAATISAALAGALRDHDAAVNRHLAKQGAPRGSSND